MKITVAQIEVIPNDPQANTAKIISIVNQAEKDGADLVTFPEMCIPGYLIGDNWERSTFIQECVDCVNDIVEYSIGLNVAIVIGSVSFDEDKNGEDGRIRKFNCAYLIRDGKVLQKRIKTLQPNYRIFDDNRHFCDLRKKHAIVDERYIGTLDYPVSEVAGKKIGLLICEDGWDDDYSTVFGDFRPVLKFEKTPDLIVNISCSPYTNGKNNKRNRTFCSGSYDSNAHILYVNNVGCQNNGKNVMVFDGGSTMYSPFFGEAYSLYSPFQEASQTFDFDFEEELPDVPGEDGMPVLYQAVKYGVQKFMQQTGITKVVIGASGGIDSCLVAAIISQVVRPTDMWLVNMPSKYNSGTTIDIAKKLAEKIGCKYSSIPIEESVELTRRQFGDGLSEFALQNVQARDRSSRILAACTSVFETEGWNGRAAFTCNGNKSELTVGYCTIMGDLAGFLAPIADLWKTQVYEMARYFNENVKDIIPKEVFDIVPSAELSVTHNVDEGKGDPIIYAYHDKLFASWVERWNRAIPEDILMWKFEMRLEDELGLDFEIGTIFDSEQAFIDDLERWWNLYSGFSVAKRVVAPPLVTVSRRSFGFDMRESQLKPYYSKGYAKYKALLLCRDKM
jgi:NAD+ synthase (glutamine-hydrolysing)